LCKLCKSIFQWAKHAKAKARSVLNTWARVSHFYWLLNTRTKVMLFWCISHIRLKKRKKTSSAWSANSLKFFNILLQKDFVSGMKPSISFSCFVNISCLCSGDIISYNITYSISVFCISPPLCTLIYIRVFALSRVTSRAVCVLVFVQLHQIKIHRWKIHL
jgi:hypothetical protein